MNHNNLLIIGNFDGVHKGHQALIAYARQKADAFGLKLIALSFEPHPRFFFNPTIEPFLLTSYADKAKLLQIYGVDETVMLPFDQQLSQLSADAFIEEILVKSLRARHIIVGHDFAFGQKRMGNIITLQERGAHFGFTAEAISGASDEDGNIYSSSNVRALIKNKAFDRAQALLGHAWWLSGEVIHGDKRGRLIGYPTANMLLADYIRLPYGVYATQITIEGDSKIYQGATNIGIRPMFESAVPLIESYIFNFDADIYGKKMKIFPRFFLRGEEKYDSLDALISQIAKDCALAASMLKSDNFEPI